MKLRLLTAGIALAIGGGNAAATVITPGTAGGSELVFFISDFSVTDTGNAPGGSTSYSQDLGITMGDFDPSQTYVFQLSPSFAVFKDPSRYNPFAGGLGVPPAIFGVAPDFGPPRPDPGFSFIDHLNWGVLAADSTTGSLLTTYAAGNDVPGSYFNGGNPFNAPTVTNARIADSATLLNTAWTDNGTGDYELNTLSGHAAPGDGSHLILQEDFLSDPNDGSSLPDTIDPAKVSLYGGAENYYLGTDVLLTGTGETNLNPRAELFELVPMYLFTQSGGNGDDPAVAEIQGDGTNVGLWYIDWDNQQLVYAPVPVPTAVWLLGSALLGLVGISRRRAGA